MVMVAVAVPIAGEKQDEAPVERPGRYRHHQRPGERGQEDPQHPEREQGEGDAEDDGGEALRGWERCRDGLTATGISVRRKRCSNARFSLKISSDVPPRSKKLAVAR